MPKISKVAEQLVAKPRSRLLEKCAKKGPQFELFSARYIDIQIKCLFRLPPKLVY